MRVILESGIFDHPHTAGGDVDTPEQQQVMALDAETEGIVLLKNEDHCCRWMPRRFTRSP